MRSWLLIVFCVAVSAWGLPGCLPINFDFQAEVLSLHPIYDAESIDFEPALLGRWSNDEVTWSLSELSESGVRLYRVVISTSDGQDSCQARLVNVDGVRFLDLHPDGGSSVPASLPWFPVHCIVQIQHSQSTIELRFMDQDWLQTYLMARPDVITHVVVKIGETDCILLSAPTDALRVFFFENAEADEAWFGSELHRAEGAPQASTESVSVPSPQSGMAVDLYRDSDHQLMGTRVQHRGEHTQLIAIYSTGDGSEGRRVFYEPYSLLDYNGDGQVDQIGYPLDYDGEITRAQADSLFEEE